MTQPILDQQRRQIGFSPKFFLELVIAEMLGLFALVFLYLNRATAEDELEDSPSA